MNVERHSWCAGVLSLSRPGALCGIRAGSQGPGGGRRRGVWRVYWLGCARGRVKPGSGTRAGHTRIGKGPGQIRIGDMGGSNPKRERTAQKRKNRRGDAGFYQRLLTGVLTKVFIGQQKTLVFTQVFT